MTSRNYGYLLGGKDNYAADREAAEAARKVWPEFAFAVARFFAGMDLVEPGLVPVEEWHPEHGDTGGAGKSAVLGAAGRKR